MVNRALASVGGWTRSAAITAALALAACGSSAPDPTTVAMSIAATGSINPNSVSEPSPVVLRVYQLKSDAAFKAAEFS